MISKKLRNVSMIVLAFVMALSLSFAIANVSQIKSASAAEFINNVVNATNTVTGDKTVTYTYPLLNSGKLKGNTFAFEVPSNTGSATLKFVDAGSNTSRYCYIYPKGVATTDRTTQEAVKDSDTPGRWSIYSGSGKTHVFGFTKDDLLVKDGKSYLVIGTADDYKFNSDFTVVATLEATVIKTINSVDDITVEQQFVVGSTIEEIEAVLPNSVTGNWTGDDGSNGTVPVSVTSWGLVSGELNVAGEVTFTGTLATSVDGYVMGSVTAPTATVTIIPDNRATITAIDDVTGDADLYGTYTLPATVTATTADGTVELTVTWESAVNLTTAGEQVINGTAEFSATEYKLADGVDASVTATITVIDNRTVVTSVNSVSYTVAQNASLTLPASITTSEGELAVTWDSYNTSATATVSGSLTDYTTYKLTDGVKITATINVIENVAVSASASWTKGESGVLWVDSTLLSTTQTSSDCFALSNDYEIINQNGVKITGLASMVGANTAQATAKHTICMMGLTGNSIRIDLPSNFAGQITVNASAFSEKQRTISFNGESKSFTKALISPEVLTWNLSKGGTYYLNNESGSNNTVYIHSIVIEGSVSSATYTYEDGETLLAAEELPLTTTGYTFIGWSNDFGATIVDAGTTATAGNYTAIFAKATFMGGSLRTTGTTGVRFGFEIELLGVEVDSFAQNVTAKFVLTTSQANEMTAKNYAVKDNKIVLNAVVVNNINAKENTEDIAKCEMNINAAITVTFANGKTVSDNGDRTIAQIAETCYTLGYVTDVDLLAKYGYTVA